MYYDDETGDRGGAGDWVEDGLWLVLLCQAGPAALLVFTIITSIF